MKAPLPKEEAQRLCALQELHVLDTEPEPGFDDIVELAAHICQTPTALVTLIDAERQWFKSAVGMDVRETHRDLSFCAHAILGTETLIVPDALRDPRFADNGLVVGPPYIRFYAGVPLIDEAGHALGALAVIDYRPRTLERRQIEMLERLARQAVAQLNLRQHLAETRGGQRRAAEELQRLFEVSRDLICSADFDGRFRRVNPAFERVLGFAVEDLAGQRFLDLVHPEDRAATEAEFERLCRGQAAPSFTNRYRKRSGEWCWLEWVSVVSPSDQLVYAVARDLTETRRLFEDLRASEAALRSAQERARLGSWDFDLRTQRGWWSPEMFRLFGLDPMGPAPSVEAFVQLIDPNQRERLRVYLEEVPRRGGTTTLTFASDPARGPQRFYQAVAETVRDATGQPVKLVGTILETTELMQAENALREQERRQATLIQNLPGIAYRCRRDEALTVEFVSEVFTQITGYDTEALLRHDVTHLGLIHPDDRDRFTDVVQRSLDGHRRYQIEYRIIRKDGEERWVREHGCGVYDEQGHVSALEGFVLDITERRRVIAALEKSERRLREFVENARDAVIHVGADRRISAVNGAFESITGWSRTEVTGRAVVDLIHPEDHRRAADVMGMMLQGKRPPVFELRLLAKKGPPVVMEFTAMPELEGQQVVGMISIGRDLTERKRLEEQLQLAQRMESIGQLAGGVAHDFNNILAVILMQSSLIESMETLSPAVIDGLKQIQLAAERAAALTRQLLTFGRRQHMQLVDIDFSMVVDNLGKMLRRIVGEDIELHTRVAGRLPLVHGDVGMLEQVVMNLVVNARDAMPRGGRITLALSTEGDGVDASGASVRRWVVLCVEDTGHGIASDVMPHIFEPFFTTKEVGKGTGLGLATVYSIVQQHGGAVEVTSEVGHGAIFRVRLPAVQRRARGSARVGGQLELRGGEETILVVEDEVNVRDLVCTVLQQKGYRVLVATSGPEALAVWESVGRKIGLLLTDIVMPAGLNGWELAQKLRATHADLPVIYMSGYSGEAVAHGQDLIEGVNFLQKPFGPIKLLGVVRAMLDRHRPV